MTRTRYSLPLGRMAEHMPDHPERTSLRDLPGVFGEIEYRVWTNRSAMLQGIGMAEQGMNPGRLRAYQKG